MHRSQRSFCAGSVSFTTSRSRSVAALQTSATPFDKRGPIRLLRTLGLARRAACCLPRRPTIAEVTRYGIQRWDWLSHFFCKSRIERDRSSVKRSNRLSALNRQKAVFASSHGGYADWIIIASLIETRKQSKVDLHS